ncbi:MAG: hypothetical protein ACXVII_40445 [Solirubrobacteraceae bacterium]
MGIPRRHHHPDVRPPTGWQLEEISVHAEFVSDARPLPPELVDLTVSGAGGPAVGSSAR